MISAKTISLAGLMLTSLVLHAQDRCGTVKYMRNLRDSHYLLEQDEQFEEWLDKKIQQRQSSRQQTGPYKIPVVFHIIHNGEAYGSGTNVRDEQIYSQLRVLNEDFRRENADGSNTPPEFLNGAGSMDIQFVLARRTPEGQATTGIVRKNGNRAVWNSGDNYDLKSLSYWPAEDYLNIWVCNIGDFLGYAQLPVSDLPGLENSSNNRLTDGVVLWHRSFGSDDDGNFDLDAQFNKGRTATHEVAHFFGLRHIWGDDEGECSGTDYVDDTPNQAGYTAGCPAHPKSTCTPSVVSMFQNFMDYTDDMCMNLFTTGQISRMNVVLENSPRRASLNNSPGLLPPEPVANDLGIRAVTSPGATQCLTTINPALLVKNYGTNKITSARIRVKSGQTVMETKDFSLDLDPLDSAVVTFAAFQRPIGMSEISFDILLTNGIVDGDAQSNANTITRELYIPAEQSLPINETFSSQPASWMIQNPDQLITWEVTDAINQGPNNKAMAMNFYDYEDNFGEFDVLYTPVFDLRNTESAVLFFDMAHARYDFSMDELRIVAITGCRDLSQGEVIYDSAGVSLATVPSRRSPFVPNSGDNWVREFIRLDDFAGERYVQLAFVGINDYGNNLYIDNVSIATSGFNDVNLRKVVRPALVSCEKDIAPQVTVQNTGTETVTNFVVEYALNDGSTVTRNFTGLSIAPGKEQTVTLDALTLAGGQNTFSVEILNPNGSPDDNPQNNIREMLVAVNETTDRIPLREDFESFNEDRWTLINPANGMQWETISLHNGEALYFNAHDNTQIGDEAWLVSPVLDLRRAEEASVQFDISYRTGLDKIEDLRVMVSRNCGSTYTDAEFTFPESEYVFESWAPMQESDWTRDLVVDLSDFAREPALRVAFVVSNANGNNLYLDNIEFFTTDNPAEFPVTAAYQVFGYDMNDPDDRSLQIGFNLDERQHVSCSLVDTMGRTVGEVTWLDVLNQVYDLPFGDTLAPGVYVVRLRIGEQVFGTRILFGK